MEFSLRMIDELLRAIKSLDLGKGKICCEITDIVADIVARAFSGINVVIVPDHWHSVLGGDGVRLENVNFNSHCVSERPTKIPPICPKLKWRIPLLR